MERNNYKCKLCSRKFSNGKALGGHMRSHLTILPIPPKTHQLSNRTESTSSSSSSEEEEEDEIIQEPEEEEEEEEEEKGGLVYGLRENPKRSFRFVDPEFSFTVDAGFIVQDRESETESSRNPTRRRSKRTRKLGLAQNQVENLEEKKKAKLRNFPRPSLAESSQTEPEPVSSVSDTSPEEDVAMCLMMLSRDIWDSKSNDNNKFCFEKYYKCETCNKVFPTFQALGGHRSASHKKIMRRRRRRRSNNNNNFQDDDDDDDQTGESRNEAGKFIVVGVAAAVDNVKKKVHECPFCDKVFGSGQALGGHKKSHYLKSKITTTTTTTTTTATSMATNCAKVGECLIDLNLPASMEDEVSAVSYAEFS